MTESRKIVLKETGLVLTGEAICVGLMLGVYAILGSFSIKVLLGGLMGGLLACGNFFVLAVVATLAADRAENQDVTGGQKLVQGAYPFRLLILAALLFLCAKTGFFDVLALVLPLLFVQPVLFIGEFFRKKGA